MYTYFAPTISVVASTFGKSPMVLFLVHIPDQSVRKTHLWLLYSITAIMIASNILTAGFLLGGYMPMGKIWRPQIPGSCVNTAVFDYRTDIIWPVLL